MPPQTLRYPSPAPDAVAEAGGGRHRRPESLAEARPARVAMIAADESGDEDPRAAQSEGPFAEQIEDPRAAQVLVPTPRSARHQRTVPAQRSRRGDRAGTDRSGAAHTGAAHTGVTHTGAAHTGVTHTGVTHTGPGRDGTGRGVRIGASRDDDDRGPRHRAGAERPSVTGSHRAPGTLPIESWLLMGKTRQQVLLASLVAAGLLLLALPTGRAVTGIDAVDAAAQRAIGTHSEKSKKDAKQTTGQPDAKTGGGQDDQATPAKPATAPAQPGAVPSGGAKHDARATGPGSSLRTTGSKAIALTFDDGPDPVQTPKILAMLDMYDIKATFCLVGEQVRKHPEVVQQIVAAGHTLCNHTWNHSLTIGKDKPEEIQADLARTSAAIEAAVPGAKVPFFRAPGGNFTDRLVSVAGGAGMTSLYWEVDPQDWDHPEGETDPAHVARVVADIKKHTRPGAIILSHDFNQPDTIAAYSKLLPWLTQNFTIGIPGQPGATPSTPPASEPTTPDPGASAGPGATPAPTGGAVDPAAQSAG